MSENDQSGEKTEQPTPKRLNDARQDGNIPRSRELSTAAVYGACVVAMMAFSGLLARGGMQWMKQALQPDLRLLQHPQEIFGHVGSLLLAGMLVISPLLAVGLLASFISPVLMGGLQWTNKSLMPKFDRMNPIAGIKRLYGPEAVAEFAKSLLRVLFVGVAGGLMMASSMPLLRGLLHKPLETAMADGLGFALRLMLATAMAFFLLAALDAPYQRWNWLRKLKMTREELKREMKESEGNPEVKGRIRQMQMQASQRRMMQDVPTADVIVVNPTHYAVALKYQGEKMNAPVVVARGVDEVALRIRALAQQHRVAVVAAPPLARALYREGQLGKEIPVRLYSAVAQVLSYVYQLNDWRQGPAPVLPALQVAEFDPEAKA
ncbi:flagellar biosynthesis protein FlhB [Stenotrophomonas ginsengisoli]|uniref:Flagellar biosynthetic protein FlhB n=1 Tax=Stenotrophomonas ginsengisoli TaxID=336566 RepID=A0A0R0DAS0_9GAMM|nr:flagellar biosynthesis protein FlhB [Stenotrophomonas ginsengisoli]KRG78939.1 flagellar biosynthesis protein FlhB [Stenotrophomonas ginsengisoli]